MKYQGDIKIISGTCLSSYPRKKLRLTYNWAFIREVEKLPYGKVKVDVYYFDFCGFVPVNYISTEIVDEKDICVLDWSMCKYLYNTQDMSYIIEQYLDYIQMFYVRCDSNYEYKIYSFNNSDEPVKIIKNDDGSDFFEMNTKIQDWMMKEVENGNVNLDKHIKMMSNKLKFRHVKHIQS